MEEKIVSAIDALFDENNTENIILYNEKEEPVEFEQIAIIPIEENVYAILKPVQEIEGVKEDEAFAFELVTINDEDSLKLVEDDAVIDRVFAEYDKLVDEQDKQD